MSRPIRIGLLAEGPAELGSSVPFIQPQVGGKAIDRSQEGAWHTFIRRELQEAGLLDCEFIHRHPSTKENRKGKLTTGHSIINQKYIAQTVSVWQPDEVDMVVILIDADEIQPAREQAITNALETIRQNHFDENDQLIPNRNAGAMAIQTFDTWFLADERSVQNLLTIATNETLPQNLETLSNTKTFLDNLIDQSDYLADLPDGQRKLQVRWQLAHTIALNTLKERCTQGYKLFMLAVCQVAQNVKRES